MDDSPAPAPRAVAPRRAVAASKPKYAEDDEESGSEQDASDDGSDDYVPSD